MRLTIPDLFWRARMHWPNAEAIHISGERPMSYAELWTLATQITQAINRTQPSANVGLLLPNGSDWIASLGGITMAGRIAVLLNPRLTSSELAYQVNQADIDTLIAGPIYGRDSSQWVQAVRESVPGLRQIVWVGTDHPPRTLPLQNWLASPVENFDCPDRSQWPSERDSAVIIYTSGTTSLPKGVMLTHQAIIRNAWIVGRRFGITSDDRIFSAGPFFHSGGLTMHVMLGLLAGVPIVSVPHFDADEVLDMVESLRCTIYNGIETLFLRLMDSPRFNPGRLRTVRTGWITGSPGILRRVAEDVGMPGIISVYGISEAAPNVTISPFNDSPDHRWSTVGQPHPWCELRIIDPTTGHMVVPGSEGEITTRGYNVMRGYYNKPEETAKTLIQGWLHTGDLGRLRSDGYLEFSGRLKDIVRVGGENVSCLEVENALYKVPGVELVAVLPWDDPLYGQVPLAAIQWRSGCAVPLATLQQQMKSYLASYKIPHTIIAVDSMPLTESGKVRKPALKQRLLQQGMIS